MKKMMRRRSRKRPKQGNKVKEAMPTRAREEEEEEEGARMSCAAN
jgi:hypothetical protein